MPTPGRRADWAPRSVRDGLVETVREAVRLGYERTVDQDAGFGFRELEDIAVKAMSPSINDPVTAAHAVGHMADLLVRLTGCRLGPTLHRDGEGTDRAIVPDRDLRYYLDLACGQLRRFAASEPSVLIALLRMLRSVATACRDDDQRHEVLRAARLVASQLPDTAAEADADEVNELLCRVEQALGGNPFDRLRRPSRRDKIHLSARAANPVLVEGNHVSPDVAGTRGRLRSTRHFTSISLRAGARRPVPDQACSVRGGRRRSKRQEWRRQPPSSRSG